MIDTDRCPASSPARVPPAAPWLETKPAPPLWSLLARLPRRAGNCAFRLAGVTARWCRGGWWMAWGVLIGAVPVAISFGLGMPGHQWLSAILLAALCLGLVRENAWFRGMGLIGLTFAVHSVVVIALSAAAPQRTAAILPGAADYWQKQQTWIATGEDPEYRLEAWVPAHVQLLAASSLFTFTSLGTVTFGQGFYEVDLMNYYNAQLLGRSHSAPLALLLGWHIWSVLRGLGYLVLTFEIISLSLAAWSGKNLSSWPARASRWGAGLGLLAADAIAKLVLLDVVRQHLDANLL
jgi:hypothetical protein